MNISQAGPISISPDFTDYFRLFVNLANLFAIFLQIPISFGNCWILLRTALIHPNLKCILVAQSACFCAFSIPRTGQIYNVLIFGPERLLDNFLIQSVLMFSITFLNSIGHILFIERILATILYRNYERQKNPVLSIGWLILISSFSAYTTFEQVLDSQDPTQILQIRLSTLISFALMVLLAFLEIFVILLLGAYNLKNYKAQLRENGRRGEHNLSERFQTFENIRTARQLAPTFALHFFNVLLINSFPFALHFGLLNNPLSIEMSTEIIFLLMTANNFGIEFSITSRHPILRRNAQKLLGKFKFSRNRIFYSESTIHQPQSIHQRRKNEADGHFEMLRKEWA